MQLLGIVLILINVGAVAVPVAAVAVIYQNNLLEVVFPAEAQQIVASTMESATTLQVPEYESYVYDPESRTLTITFEFTNPLRVDLRVNSVTADVKCSHHNFTLGQAGLSKPVQLDSEATVIMTVVFVWTQAAEEHFLAVHRGESSIDIELVNLVWDVSGIRVEAPEVVALTIPLTI